MWSNNYIGLPFKYKGRTKEGLDCWGLTRLIYQNEYKITLPSLSENYEANDVEHIAELIAQYKEGWESVDKPNEGDVVLFKVMGNISHIGVAISATHFIHARENYDSAIEAFDSPYWKKRVVGYFKYSQNKSVILNAVPHPLRTERYTVPIPAGTNLEVLANWILKEYKVAEEIKSKVNIIVNGRIIPKEVWASTILKDTDVVEYRSVPTGGDTTRLFLTLAVIYVSVVYGPQAGEALGFTTANGYTAAQSAAFGTAAISMTGVALVNYIAPIRLPEIDAGKDAGSAERQLMLNGGTNHINPYGAIPVILGKVRVTPPLASVNYLTYENERDSYLSMLLAWGYGPLTIDSNSYRVGEQPLSNYTDYTLITLDRKTTETQLERDKFDAIYGKDITQINPNLVLVCDGNPEGTAATFNLVSNVCTISKVAHGAITGEKVYVFIKLDYTWSDETGSGGEIIDASGEYTVTSYTADTFTITINQPDKSGNCSFTKYGPWAESISTERVDSVTVAIHFPQGLRKVKVKGDGAGDSYTAPVSFDLQYYFEGSWISFQSITIGSDSPKKDAFTFTKTYNIYDTADIPVNNGLSIRIRRTTGDNVEDNPDYRYSHISILQVVTFTRNATPALDPLGCKLAKSAFKIKATDQLNGSIEGINAIVQTYCKAWNGTAWVDSSTSNPAALFRYVLEHPANSQKITNPTAKFDLVQLQHWSTYCDTKGFKYNAVVGTQRSVLEVLRDICAAGRASPALIDGKWTVTIDEEKPNVIQHFTPHNSWGFESTKVLPKLPDGLRITYFDEDKEYQESEIIVYALGKNADNSTLFEAIQLPGVTNKNSVIDHARWHMAQSKLRPEVYTLNADIEYLVCNRGDRVKVAHDVPMWGLGSGRIKNRISDTVMELDEEISMQASKSYTIRVRASNGTSAVRSVTPVSVDGYYTQVILTSSATISEMNSGDLFLFGELDSESQDLIVLSIEPTTNKSARITMVDYGVTSEYNIFNDYLILTESTTFESQITLPPRLLIESLNEHVPAITGLISDESVMEKISAGSFKYNLKVSFVNTSKLPSSVTSVQIQYDYAASTDGLNYRLNSTDYSIGSVNVPDVTEGEVYKVRLRYVTLDGRFGKWSEWATTTIVGKTTPPSSVTGFIAEAESNTGRLRLTWDNNTEIDVKGYEVRTTDVGWGTSQDRIFYGSTNTCSTISEDVLHITTYYIRAFDYGNNYSKTSTSLVYTAPPPEAPTHLSYVYGTSSNTHSTVTFSWEPPTHTHFAIKEYQVVITKPNHADETVTITSTKYISNADWIGNATISISSIDMSGSISSPALLTVPKYIPNPLVSFNADVVDNNVLLRWVLPEKTSLPISHILIKRGATWETPDKIIGEKSGTFTSIFELAGGNYTYWLSVVDTDGRESIPTPISLSVSQPPDFVFNAEYISLLDGTKYNVGNITNTTSLLMLINNSETWEQHFTSHSWASPQDQINASYPIYAQPDTTPAYYREVFNYGQLLTSSSITVSFTGSVVSGTPNVYTEIETSVDGTTWTSPQKLDAIFATNFQYIRVTINAIASSTLDLYKLDKLIVRLDNKQISDSGTASCLSTDSLGTIVNFNKEFIDIQSINLTPAGTTSLTSVYDFKDATIIASYSIASGVCTVNATAHGLITGQNVRLAFSTGTAISGTYTITKVDDNQYTVSAIGQPSTSGNVVTYAQSMRIYVFTSTSGIRQNANVGWSIKGY